MRISEIYARQILDSRGNPTVEVDVYLENGIFGRAAVPSGASTGEREALELRDGGKDFLGKGVKKAVENVNKIIAPKIEGMNVFEQKKIDQMMIEIDGTENKSKLGANAILATSLAVAKAAASTYGMWLYEYLGGLNAKTMPVPLMNFINGGVHAGNKLDVQEFMIIPLNADSFSEALRIAVEVYHELKQFLKERYGLQAINIGDEGGFAPPMSNTREALNALIGAIKRAGYGLGGDVALALDVAASQLYSKKTGTYRVDGLNLKPQELLDYYIELINEYPIVSIEDPFMEDDFQSFAKLLEKTKNKILIVGDDLFVTNIERLRKGIKYKSCNAILVKVNQIGTLTEAVGVINEARRVNYRAIISHRSGETEDTTIAHLAVAFNTGLIKTGAPARGERTAKYNELLRIEERLGSEAKYPGWKILPGKPS